MPVVSSLAAAIAFLTRIPVGRLTPVTAADVARAAPLFPVVGAGVGAVGAGVALLCEPPLSPLLAAALAAAATTAVTGALHLDGLADTLDALGATGRERSLEIMRDSRIGTFGAAGAALALVVRVAVLAQLVGGGGILGGAIAAGGLSRGASATLAAALPYARAPGGTGGVLTGSRAIWAAPVAVVVALAALRLDGLVVAGAVAAIAVVLALAFRSWLGGVTGDMLGATSEVSELAALVVVAALR